MADKHRILVVEDSRTQALRLKHVLEQNGYAVAVCDGGREALAWLETTRPDIVVSDIVMPGMDGYELCRRIKDDPALNAIPVVLLTTLSDHQDIIHGLQAGANSYLTKPCSDEALLSRVRYVLTNADIRGQGMTEMGLSIMFGGEKYVLTAERVQILDLLLGTYEEVLNKNAELQRTNRELRDALSHIKTLQGLIPICSKCKKIRNDDGYWEQVEEYVTDHSEARFSHGFCPECFELALKELDDE